MEYFKTSYYKVAENECYYYSEDQFDTQRNNAVLKIHKLLEISTGMLEPVLDFNIKTASGYSGYGRNILKFPDTYSSYNQVFNTQLLSPLMGTLKAGTEQLFVLSTKDFSAFTIITNGEWNRFTKNAQTGNFEFTLVVPSDIETLIISGVTTTGNRSTAKGLVRYNIVK